MALDRVILERVTLSDIVEVTGISAVEGVFTATTSCSSTVYSICGAARTATWTVMEVGE